MFFMETRLNRNKMQVIINKIAFTCAFMVDCEGQSSGLALLWKERIEVDVANYSRNHIDAKIILEGSESPWRFTGFYGFPERHNWRRSWTLLKQLASLNPLPWMLTGDFNDLRSDAEKEGQHPHPKWLMDGFNEAILSCGLREVEFGGSQFTWEKSRGKVEWEREKLDRILAMDAWIDLFEGAKAIFVPITSSDHIHLVIWASAVERITRQWKFIFENSWIKKGDCRVIVQNTW